METHRATIHVATSGDDTAAGTEAAPLRTIDQAAQRAMAGDTVVVHAGVYREWVKPRRGGLSDARRITYTAAEGEHVRITGSEPVTGWVDEGDGVWRATVPNALFGDWNPFVQEVTGDWIVYAPGAPRRHRRRPTSLGSSAPNRRNRRAACARRRGYRAR